jgi:hypothetical protein
LMPEFRYKVKIFGSHQIRFRQTVAGFVKENCVHKQSQLCEL